MACRRESWFIFDRCPWALVSSTRSHTEKQGIPRIAERKYALAEFLCVQPVLMVALDYHRRQDSSLSVDITS